jgi:hypothetical protein
MSFLRGCRLRVFEAGLRRVNPVPVQVYLVGARGSLTGHKRSSSPQDWVDCQRESHQPECCSRGQDASLSTCIAPTVRKILLEHARSTSYIPEAVNRAEAVTAEQRIALRQERPSHLLARKIR